MARRLLIVLVVSLFAVGCTTRIDPRARQFIINADVDRVKDATIVAFADANYDILSESEHILVFEGAVVSGLMSLWHTSDDFKAPRTRYRVALVGDRPTKVLFSAFIVADPNTPKEKSTSAGNYTFIREQINQLARRIREAAEFGA